MIKWLKKEMRSHSWLGAFLTVAMWFIGLFIVFSIVDIFGYV